MIYPYIFVCTNILAKLHLFIEQEWQCPLEVKHKNIMARVRANDEKPQKMNNELKET